MKVMSFANSKGGVSKSTSIGAISSILGAASYKVLIVDLDPQKNITRTFTNGTEYVEPDNRLWKNIINSDFSSESDGLSWTALFCEKFAHKQSMQEYIVPSNSDNIDILPSTFDLAFSIYYIYDKCKESSNAITYFKHNLNLLKNDYDYVLIDTSPFMSYLTMCSIAASDYIVSPINTDNYSYDGLGQLIDVVEMINTTYNTQAEFKGVFLTRVKRNTVVYKDLAKAYQSEFEDKFIPISVRDCISVTEANTALLPLFKYTPGCVAIEDYIKITNYLGLLDNAHYKKLEKVMGGIA